MLKLILFILFTVTAPLFAHAATDNCIAVIISGSESRKFWADVIKGAQQAGKELDIMIHARGTVNDHDSVGQRYVLRHTMKKYNCQGVLIAPSDASRNRDIAKLHQKGIPTVYIDRDTGGDRLAVVKTDNYQAGWFAAQKLYDKLGANANIALFRVHPDVTSTAAREQGFIDHASELGLNIVSDTYLGSRIGEARGKADDVFAQAQHIDGIFTPNDTTTVGVIMAREQYKRHQGIIHIGFDESDFIRHSVDAHRLHGYITQQPFVMGYQGIQTLHQALSGNLPLADIATPINYFSQE